MKRVIIAADGLSSKERANNATQVVSNVYYHYDDNFYRQRDVISAKSIESDAEVRAAYLDKTSKDCTKVIYMLSEPSDEYAETYRYEYQVIADDTLEVSMDYSYVMCIGEEAACRKKFESRTGEPFVRADYIELMSSAYIGNDVAKSLLADQYGYSVSNKVEYISEKAQVVKRVKRIVTM